MSILPLLLAAILPRGARPHDLQNPGVDVPGVFVKNRSGRGSSGHKLLISTLRMMPVYGCGADRNAAKRTRRARRLAGVHS
jgi:hypothetical protein